MCLDVVIVFVALIHMLQVAGVGLGSFTLLNHSELVMLFSLASLLTMVCIISSYACF